MKDPEIGITRLDTWSSRHGRGEYGLLQVKIDSSRAPGSTKLDVGIERNVGFEVPELSVQSLCLACDAEEQGSRDG